MTILTREIAVLDKGFVKLDWVAPILDSKDGVWSTDQAVVNAARVSFDGVSKGPDKDRKLLNYLMENRHMTPFEMVETSWTVKAPIFVARQWQRHRTASINEVSRRYTSENIEFYNPKHWRAQAKDNKQASDGVIPASDVQASLQNLYLQEFVWAGDGESWYESEDLFECVSDTMLGIYNKLIEAGVAREQARTLLPQTMYTKFIWKINLRNLLHFLELRNHHDAQWEMQQYAARMDTLVSVFAPWTYEAWRKSNKHV